MNPDNVILCEGYHDRAFLAGWLESLGCVSLKDKSYRDGKPLRGGGQYGFHRAANDTWVRILPVEGDGNLLQRAKIIIKEATSKPINNVVVVFDRDTYGADEGSRRDSFKSFLADPEVGANADGERAGAVETRIRLIEWHTPNDAAIAAEVPAKHTLERLVCAAIEAAYPGRSEAVATWLASRPGPPETEKRHKSTAASHMAGWYSERGYEGLFRAVWEDKAVAAALHGLLSGARTELGWLVE